MLDSRHAFVRARAVLCLVGGLIWCASALGCARIVKRYPAAEQSNAGVKAKSEAKYRPPKGAECRSRQDIDENTDEPCESDTTPAWPAWSDQQPPGVCYTVDEPCEGVADHVA